MLRGKREIITTYMKLKIQIILFIFFYIYTHTQQNWLNSSSPVVVKPSAVAGNDDVVGLLTDVVLAGVHQSIYFSFALLFVILQVRTEGGVSRMEARCCLTASPAPEETSHLSRQHGVILHII